MNMMKYDKRIDLAINIAIGYDEIFINLVLDKLIKDLCRLTKF